MERIDNRGMLIGGCLNLAFGSKENVPEKGGALQNYVVIF